MFVRATLLIAVLSLHAGAQTYEIDREQSIFSMVTQRGGIAARLAHDHLIAAQDYEAALTIEDGKVASFSFRCEVEKLAVDNPALKERWTEALAEANLLRAPFKALSESDRKTVREHMLAADQLDAEAHPEISAVMRSIEERAITFRDSDYTHQVELEFTVRGETVVRKVPARIALNDDTLTIEASAAFRFTEFGITPYSALFGAVKNQDEFFVYASFVAVRLP